MTSEAYHYREIREEDAMSRTAAWLLSLPLFILPLSAHAGDGASASGTTPQAGTTADIQDYISAITGDMDQNPHNCFEADDETQERPDLAGRPQS